MPRCSVCEIRKEQIAAFRDVIAQQASAIEALTRALDAARPAVASPRPLNTDDEQTPPKPPMPEAVTQSIVRVAGVSGPMRDHLEAWAQEAMSFGMDEQEVARKIYEGDND